MNKYLTIILKKMCSIVKADFNKIDFKKKDWYTKYSWTEKQEKDFRKWFVDFIYNKNRAQQELYDRTRLRKRGRYGCEGRADMFLLNYGWKTIKLQEE